MIADEQEAKLAVDCSALCEYRGVIYAAHSAVYTKNPRGHTMWSIVLQSRRVNSVIQAPLDQVSVVQWNLPEDVVQRVLKKKNR
ncbi:MAG: hypothetical protein IJF33_06770 [Clostridia bacterium]|nr:hypothetical protein [Clostridia bacterium]